MPVMNATPKKWYDFGLYYEGTYEQMEVGDKVGLIRGSFLGIKDGSNSFIVTEELLIWIKQLSLVDGLEVIMQLKLISRMGNV